MGAPTKPLLSDFYISGINPSRSTRLISHPVEDGSKIFDQKVVEPERISITGKVYNSDQDTFAKIHEMIENKEFKFYLLSTLTLDHDNMALERMSERQSAESPDASEVTLEFQEILKVSAQSQIPQNPENSPTKKT